MVRAGLSPRHIASKNNTRTKPKRPLHAYNLFYKFDRVRVLAAGGDNADLQITSQDVLRVSHENRLKLKRPHRKVHGKIKLLDLTRCIADRWNKLSPSSRKIFEDQALVEKEEYERNLQLWDKETEAIKYHVYRSGISVDENARIQSEESCLGEESLKTILQVKEGFKVETCPHGSLQDCYTASDDSTVHLKKRRAEAVVFKDEIPAPCSVVALSSQRLQTKQSHCYIDSEAKFVRAQPEQNCSDNNIHEGPIADCDLDHCPVSLDMFKLPERVVSNSHTQGDDFSWNCYLANQVSLMKSLFYNSDPLDAVTMESLFE